MWTTGLLLIGTIEGSCLLQTPKRGGCQPFRLILLDVYLQDNGLFSHHLEYRVLSHVQQPLAISPVLHLHLLHLLKLLQRP